jgi:hypothetical protein
LLQDIQLILLLLELRQPGIASFLTSDTAKIMAGIWLDSVNKYGLFDAETGRFILPPGMLDSFLSSEGPDMSNAENNASPIIIDLDGDGIETLSVSSGVFFDHDGNQFAENTGWVAPDDGLLIFDRDGNGKLIAAVNSLAIIRC